MGEGTKLILSVLAVALIGVGGLLFYAIDYYIPSNAIAVAVQGSSAGEVEDRLYKALRGCRRGRVGSSHSYTRGSIGKYYRSFPSIRNDKGWFGGTHVRCGPTGCTVTASAMIADPRESASCRSWQPISGSES